MLLSRSTPRRTPAMHAESPAPPGLTHRIGRNALTRRDTLWLLGVSVGAGAMQGCATSPVSGKRILVGLSESQEIAIDRQQSPHQFSADLGAVQDASVNAYLSEVGQRVDAQAERAGLPYSYRALNANYVNAYTFPAGAVGVTRGILVKLQDESELAALLGHELGHVNARHAAQRQGQALIAQVALAGLAASTENSDWAPLIGLGAQLGASALLSRYSRDNEREADALGQRYLVEAGYPASGMVRLHQVLVDQSREQPSLIETMFSSHPMSAQRLETARLLAESDYAASARAPTQRDRYMDRTARLRALAPEGRLHLLGARSREDVVRLLQAADLLVLPSEREGWPNVVTEALACGTPVLATPVGGIPDILTAPHVGALVRTGDHRALAREVERFLRSPSNPDAVRAFAQRFGWEAPIDVLRARFAAVGSAH